MNPARRRTYVAAAVALAAAAAVAATLIGSGPAETSAGPDERPGGAAQDPPAPVGRQDPAGLGDGLDSGATVEQFDIVRDAEGRDILVIGEPAALDSVELDELTDNAPATLTSLQVPATATVVAADPDPDLGFVELALPDTDLDTATAAFIDPLLRTGAEFHATPQRTTATADALVDLEGARIGFAFDRTDRGVTVIVQLTGRPSG